MAHYRNMCFFLLALSCSLRAQTPAGSVQRSSTGEASPVLFGTNVNLEGSSTTKGVQLGLGVHQEDKNTKKKRSGVNSQLPLFR
jgi:hypothetical protein